MQAIKNSGKWFRFRRVRTILALAVFVFAAEAIAAVRTASVSGFWTNTATWGEAPVPVAGDDVVINSGVAVLLDEASPALNAITNNGTLTFIGWTTALNAGEVYINGNMNHYTNSATTTNELGEWISDNRIWVVCSNFFLAAGKTNNVSGCGFTQSRGPGVTVGNRNVGASHGGRGTSGATGAIYGEPESPWQPGSGGGGNLYIAEAGRGGGAVRIEATGTVSIFGTILADGTAGSNAGGGSGGSIWISCLKLAGSGTLSAKGGNTSSNGGAGGGGRVAVDYDPDAQSGSEPPTITFETAGGRSSSYPVTIYGQPGTAYFPDSIFYPTPVVAGSAVVVIPSFTNWHAPSLTIDRAWVRFTTLKSVKVDEELIVRGGWARLDFLNRDNEGWDDASIVCSTLTVTNGASLYIYTAATNDGAPGYSTLLKATSQMTVAPTSTLYVYSHRTNGGSVFMDVHRLEVHAGGTISADGEGFEYWHGPGRQPNTGQVQEGGGYGGGGGKYNQPPLYLSNTYGDSNAPVQPGSPGGGGSRGGGLIWMKIEKDAVVDGLLTADALDSSSTDRGGGSGGGIWLWCRRLKGGGEMRARGFDGNRGGAGGGGGRIAVWYSYNEWAGTLVHPDSVQGGIDVYSGRDGEPGTIVWQQMPVAGMRVRFY